MAELRNGKGLFMKGAVLRGFWTFCVFTIGVGLLLFTLFGGPGVAARFEGGGAAWLIPLLIGMAFLAEYVDSSLGMGYGTTLTPVLLILGFRPLDVVPAVLVSELVSGLAAGALHHAAGNVDLRRDTRARRVMWILAGCSVAGTLLAVFVAVNISRIVLTLFVGVMILAMGGFILLSGRVEPRFSWRKVVGLGTIAAFNKGLSGGGYGPLVTGGQIASGISGKTAVAITSLAEGLVCFVGLAAYVALKGWPAWTLALPLTAGAALSVPLAAVTVRVLPEAVLRRGIGAATLFLGTLMLLKSAL